MADQGGHGGVSVNEVSTPMVFITDSILSHTGESTTRLYLPS